MLQHPAAEGYLSSCRHACFRLNAGFPCSSPPRRNPKHHLAPPNHTLHPSFCLIPPTHHHRKVPTPVKPDKQLFLGRLCVPGRPVPPLLAELMPQRLLQSAMEAAGEQPLERQHHQQQQQEQEQQHSEQPAQQQLFGSIASMGNGSTAPPAAAAVADGALGRLQDGAADAPTAGGVQAQDQQQNRQQLDRRPGVKRLSSSGNWVLDTHSGLQPAAPKKPKVVAGQQFGSNSSSVPYKGQLANVSAVLYHVGMGHGCGVGPHGCLRFMQLRPVQLCSHSSCHR